jgi:hypothetical protein
VAFEDHIELLLDEALQATFPASDPVALVVAAERWRAAQQPDAKGQAHEPARSAF